MARREGGRISLKRIKINQANSRMFVAVAVASAITAICIVILSFLWDLRGFNNRVIAERKETLSVLQENVTNAKELAEDYDALEQSDVDSTVVLDALPPILDFPALPVSIQNLADDANVELASFSGSDFSDSATTEAFDPSPVPIPLSIEVRGDYENIQTMIKDIERVIRPIQVVTVEYTGTNREMTADIRMVTFYQPATSVELDTVKEVR